MPFAAPQNFTGQVLSPTQLWLTWDAVDGATAHQVKKDGVVINGFATASAVDNDFDPAEEAVYEVRAFIIEFDIGPEPLTLFGAPAFFTVGDPVDPPAPPDPPDSLTVPQGLQATQTGLEQVTLTWELLTPATDIDVEIDGAVTRIPAATSFVESGITQGAEREYRIRAVSTASTPEVVSDWTALVSITIVGLGVPDPNVSVLSSTRLFVDWADIPGATRYEVEVDGTVQRIGLFSAYLDAGLSPVQTRVYRVRAVSGDTVGDWSAEVTATTNRTQPLIITGVVERRSYFPSDRWITSRALSAEFNNIYALLNGGSIELTPIAPTAPDPGDDGDDGGGPGGPGGPGPPDPPVPPDPPDGPGPDPVPLPEPGGLTAVWNNGDIDIDWDAVTWPAEVPSGERRYRVRVTDAGGVTYENAVTGTSDTAPDQLETAEHVIRVQAMWGTLDDVIAVGPPAQVTLPANAAPPITEPVVVSATATGLTASGTTHPFNVPSTVQTGERVLVIAAVFPNSGQTPAPDWGSVSAGWTFAPDPSNARPIGAEFPITFVAMQAIAGATPPATGTLSLTFSARVEFHIYRIQAPPSAPAALGPSLVSYLPLLSNASSVRIYRPAYTGTPTRVGLEYGAFPLISGQSMQNPFAIPFASTVTVGGIPYIINSFVLPRSVPAPSQFRTLALFNTFGPPGGPSIQYPSFGGYAT